MHDYIMTEDRDLWDIILHGSHVPMSKIKYGEVTRLVPKTQSEYNQADRKKINKNYRANKLLICEITPNEYNWISTCELTKEIWFYLKTIHEDTT